MCTGNREKGASAVEFAIVLPVLMAILFGIIEFGLILYDKAVVTNCSREGARAGIVFRVNSDNIPVAVPPEEITSTISTYCASLISLGSVPAAMDPPIITGNCAVPGNSLTVTVSYPYSFLVLPNFVGGMANGLRLSGTTVMRCENQNP